MVLRSTPRSKGSEKATSDRILSAAVTLFAKQGFAATGIREIADNAGVTTSSLYHYMGGKQDLLVRIMTDGLSRHAASIVQALQGVEDPAAQLVTLVRISSITEILQTESSLVIDTEIRSLSAEGRAAVLPLRREIEGFWAAALTAGQAAGTFHIRHIKLARLALIEMCNGVGHWFSSEGEFTPAEVVDQLADLALVTVDAHDPHGSQICAGNLAIQPAEEVVLLVIEIWRGVWDARDLEPIS